MQGHIRNGGHAMVQEEVDHLSRISTLWTVVGHAKEGPADAVSAAQQELLRRYHGAANRYLLGALRNVDAADELAQEFALRFLRGDFRGADRGRGRFRDFLKGVLCHLIADYYRRQRHIVKPLLAKSAELAASPCDSEERDRQFAQSWRDELLSRTWDALAQIQEETGQPFHAVMQFRIQHPDLRSPKMAEQLSAQLDQRLTADWVRQTLHRGREKFAELLLAEVADTLQDPGPDAVEEELIDLGLLCYCQPALQRYRRKKQGSRE
jgi:DNA-directed RNA polymerase specialized sigma24 family protein